MIASVRVVKSELVFTLGPASRIIALFPMRLHVFNYVFSRLIDSHTDCYATWLLHYLCQADLFYARDFFSYILYAYAYKHIRKSLINDSKMSLSTKYMHLYLSCHFNL